MKKAIKKYLTQLHENEEKGFSLVELIIVMAIMAILVGVVASQVIPYMEKSRQSKDQQVISSLLTDVTSAIAQSGEACVGGDTTFDKLKDVTNAKTETELLELRPGNTDITTLNTKLKGQLKSKAFTGKDINISVDATTGKTVIYLIKDGSGNVDKTNSKSFVASEED